ncbi:MAG: DUF3800 domain-containing protein, partial [Sulfitobacter sp.]
MYTMYCFVDESGNTGQNLFDDDQPILYYGVITCRVNLDVLAEPLLKRLRHRLGVDRLHANQLGVARLSEIALDLAKFSTKKDVRFSLFKVSKPDHAIITFFDQVFDAGLNDAISWEHYWTPLRYMLLFKVAHLFDRETAEKAWKARKETSAARARELLQEVYATLLERIDTLPDARSRDLVSGGLKWAAAHPFEIGYEAGNKDSALQISPNLVGFQQVLQSIADQAIHQSRKVRAITVDRQTEFNKAQDELAGLYRKMRGHKQSMGPGMPEMNMTNMPEVPPRFQPGDESAGLELVDVTLWATKRVMEGKPVSPELEILLKAQTKRGVTDEVSLSGLDKRWRHLVDLPAPTVPINPDLQKVLDENEARRKRAISTL